MKIVVDLFDLIGLVIGLGILLTMSIGFGTVYLVDWLKDLRRKK